MALALITGASSGIGMEFAKVHAARGGDLFLVARSGEVLREMKQKLEAAHRIAVHVMEQDLGLPNAAQNVYKETKRLGLRVDYLINNAGFGDYGFFAETSWPKEESMIQLNITALTHLCKLYLPEMVGRKQGRILNVASTAAFQPGPKMAVYFATKAYVLHFTEALANELAEHGVTATALCPGATESNFAKAADVEAAGLFKNKKLPSSRTVAEYGYDAMLKGKTVAIHGFMNSLLARTTGFMPRGLVTKVTRMVIG